MLRYFCRNNMFAFGFTRRSNNGLLGESQSVVSLTHPSTTVFNQSQTSPYVKFFILRQLTRSVALVIIARTTRGCHLIITEWGCDKPLAKVRDRVQKLPRRGSVTNYPEYKRINSTCARFSFVVSPDAPKHLCMLMPVSGLSNCEVTQAGGRGGMMKCCGDYCLFPVSRLTVSVSFFRSWPGHSPTITAYYCNHDDEAKFYPKPRCFPNIIDLFWAKSWSFVPNRTRCVQSSHHYMYFSFRSMFFLSFSSIVSSFWPSLTLLCFMSVLFGIPFSSLFPFFLPSLFLFVPFSFITLFSLSQTFLCPSCVPSIVCFSCSRS